MTSFVTEGGTEVLEVEYGQGKCAKAGKRVSDSIALMVLVELCCAVLLLCLLVSGVCQVHGKTGTQQQDL